MGPNIDSRMIAVQTIVVRDTDIENFLGGHNIVPVYLARRFESLVCHIVIQ